MTKDKLQASEKMLLIIMKMREREREKGSTFRDRFDFILGPAHYRHGDPSINELIMAVQAGDLNLVIDLLDTSDGPIDPNATNQVNRASLNSCFKKM
jgi:hypothetical protein